ncbi:glutathione S-transferase family protein [Limobrevibacterium gyesilva]|uniref:Glutathione S-transferase family protein n=1 Tax=Limobrevibacterium gyesilva TaxID=2991712 RepID=A0AA41YQ29_9PROT|nr:glutathione S-transferase family protein [Limobrevibacterium gyesilva]MCW3476188.1 glutathione S-transferase family protein [Limobrevibacterium gyesilva]
MLFYNSVGPNPRVVRMFMAERGIDVPKTEIDLRGGENRRAPYLAKNPMGQMPALELDDGSVLTEITAICEYLDEVAPGASLLGSTARERAETRMWTRRIDLNIVEPLGNGFRFAEGLKLFRDRIRVIPQAADDLKLVAQEKLAWLDKQMQGKAFVCGARFTLADVLLFAFLDFGATVGQPLNPELTNIGAWFARVKARPSAAA